MTQAWRKFSRSFIMFLGTLSLLMVVTGLSADLTRTRAWTYTTPSQLQGSPKFEFNSDRPDLDKKKQMQILKMKTQPKQKKEV